MINRRRSSHILSFPMFYTQGDKAQYIGSNSAQLSSLAITAQCGKFVIYDMAMLYSCEYECIIYLHKSG